MLIDSAFRKIDYLRISITDMCNLRCIYCQIWQEIGSKRSHYEILSYEEIIRLAFLMVELGIRRIRITGGEPLIKRNVISLIEELSKLKLCEELSLTTNGTKLAQFAYPLKNAGINRINISLDSLNKDRYFKITGGGNLNDVLIGIEEALKAGLDPIKINMVVMKGVNDDEMVDFVQFALDKPVYVRFIEFMPIGQQRNFWERRYLPSAILKKRLSLYFDLISTNGVPGNGPAEYYQVNGMGKIGFISPMSNHFCSRCNRLRLTSDGHLRLCLGEEIEEVDLKQAIRDGVSNDEIKELIIKAIKRKPKGHQFHLEVPNGRQMWAIGG